MHGAVLDLGVDHTGKHYRAKSEGKPNRPSAEAMIDDYQGGAKYDSYTNNRFQIRTFNDEGQCDGEYAHNHGPDNIEHTIDRRILTTGFTLNQTCQHD